MTEHSISEPEHGQGLTPSKKDSPTVNVSAKHIRGLVDAGYGGLIDYAFEIRHPVAKKIRAKERHLLCEVALCNCRTAISLVEAGVSEQKLVNSIFWSGTLFLSRLEPREWLSAWETLEQHPVVRNNLDWRMQVLDGIFDFSPNRSEIFEIVLNLEGLQQNLERHHLAFRDYFVASMFLGRAGPDEVRQFAKRLVESDWQASTKREKKRILKLATDVLKG